VAAVADARVRQLWGKWGLSLLKQRWNNAHKAPTPRSPDDEEGWLLLSNALVAAKTAVKAVTCNMTARDLATTLIIVIATPKLIAAAQVGDVCVAEDGEGTATALTAPQQGEYINETTFLVSPNALDKAQMNLWRKKAANIALLSDGLQLLA